MHVAATLVTVLLVSQLFFKARNRQASLFDWMSAVKELYQAWRSSPAIVWLVNDLRKVGGGSWKRAFVLGVVAFGFAPIVMWVQFPPA